MSTVFDHPLWSSLGKYARLSDGRDNLDLLQLPDELRAQAMALSLPCVACAAPCHVFRARLKSERSRVAGQVEEHRLFYAATCPSTVNAGCSRSKAAKSHKRRVRELLGKQREAPRAIAVKVLDASGQVLCTVRSEVKEEVPLELPWGAARIVLVPA